MFKWNEIELTEDEYNLLKKIMNNAKKQFEIGDKVKIIDDNESYTGYHDWVYTHISDATKCRYAYGCVPKKGIKAVVISNRFRLDNGDVIVYVQNVVGNHECYLMSIDGLAKIDE